MSRYTNDDAFTRCVDAYVASTRYDAHMRLCICARDIAHVAYMRALHACIHDANDANDANVDARDVYVRRNALQRRVARAFDVFDNAQTRVDEYASHIAHIDALRIDALHA